MKKIWQANSLNSSVVPFLLALSLLGLFRTFQNLPAIDNLVVATTSGKIRGVSRPAGGAEFLGIPYAKAPVGDLRWHEPVPTQSWNGVHEANSFGAPCAQPILGDWNKHDAETSKEDCLFLNVITRAWPPKAALPVMFWIHGGAHAGGTASSALYKDGTLVQHGVVLVTASLEPKRQRSAKQPLHLEVTYSGPRPLSEGPSARARSQTAVVPRV